MKKDLNRSAFCGGLDGEDGGDELSWEKLPPRVLDSLTSGEVDSGSEEKSLEEASQSDR